MAFVKKLEPKNLQPHLDIQKNFIGRTGELLYFVQNILKPEEPTHNIISISGQGGVGKSALLKQFINKTRVADFKDHCLAAVANERQVTATSVMEKFADQLREAGHTLTNFEDALVHYKDALRKLQLEQDKMRDTVLRKTATDVAGSALKGIPIMGGILEEVAKTTTGFVVDEFLYHRMLKDAERLE
jgi:Cdc6-like AAA superfamily ATPase